MPDWRRIVRDGIEPLGFTEQVNEEVISELAAHLEDAHEDLCASGSPEDQATRLTLGSAGDWSLLRRRIQRSREGIMNTRTRQILLPGMMSLVLSVVWQTMVSTSGIYHPTVILLGPHALVLYLPWLLALPLIGAASALWSRTEGGSPRRRLFAASAPAALIGALLLATFLLGFVVDRHLDTWLRFGSLGVWLLGWVIIPGTALLLGAAPFLKETPGCSEAQVAKS